MIPLTSVKIILTPAARIFGALSLIIPAMVETIVGIFSIRIGEPLREILQKFDSAVNEFPGVLPDGAG